MTEGVPRLARWRRPRGLLTEGYGRKGEGYSRKGGLSKQHLALPLESLPLSSSSAGVFATRYADLLITPAILALDALKCVSFSM